MNAIQMLQALNAGKTVKRKNQRESEILKLNAKKEIVNKDGVPVMLAFWPNEITKDNWEIYDKVLIKDFDRNYLRDVISPFYNQVVSITKESVAGASNGYLHISLYNKFIMLPLSNDNHQMFENLTWNKPYTLEELGL